MECSIRENNGKTMVVIYGDLDSEHASEIFRETMKRALTLDRKDAVIDMSGVGNINSHGIAKLLLFYKKFKDSGRVLRITSPQGQVREILETLMLDKLFKID